MFDDVEKLIFCNCHGIDNVLINLSSSNTNINSIDISYTDSKKFELLSSIPNIKFLGIPCEILIYLNIDKLIKDNNFIYSIKDFY